MTGIIERTLTEKDLDEIVAIEVAFVKLVEYDDAEVRQQRIGLQPRRQNPLRRDKQLRTRRETPTGRRRHRCL